MKRLYKSGKNKVLSGVLGGVGEYLDADPVVIRLVFLLLVMATGVLPGVLAYLVAIFIVPKPKSSK